MTDLLKIGAGFKIEGEPYSCKEYGSGHIHGTYLLESGEMSSPKRYILQHLNTSVFKKPESVQDNISRILTFLSKSPDPDPDTRDLEMVETLDGKFGFHDRDGRYWRCFLYIKDSITLESVETSEQAYEGGRSFGIFMARLKDYNPRRLHITIPHFMDAEWRNKQLAFAEFANPGKRLKNAQSELKRIRDLSEIPEKFTRIRTALSDRVTHNDAKITNVLFDANTGKGVGIIDLDTVMTGTLLTDFGDMVRSFTAKGKEDETGPDFQGCREDYFTGLATGFSEAVRAFITDVERSNLLLGAKVVIYMQAVRFLTDYLNGDTYYKTNYPEQNLFRTRNQLGLLESLLTREQLLQGILHRSF